MVLSFSGILNVNNVDLDFAELERNSLKEKRLINNLEAELRHEKKVEMSRRCLGLLRSQTAQYEITANEVLIGRKTAEDVLPVSIDLTPEPFSHKISRQQAIIQLTENLEFHFINVGRQSVDVNGELTPPKTSRVLYDQCFIEVSFPVAISPPLLICAECLVVCLDCRNRLHL